MTRLNRDGEPGYQQVKDYPLNPKALSLGELYGEFDLNTNEWTDGVMSSVMRQTCAGVLKGCYLSVCQSVSQSVSVFVYLSLLVRALREI